MSFLFSFKKGFGLRLKIGLVLGFGIGKTFKDGNHHRWRSGAHISMTSRSHIVRINVQCGRKSPVEIVVKKLMVNRWLNC